MSNCQYCGKEVYDKGLFVHERGHVEERVRVREAIEKREKELNEHMQEALKGNDTKWANNVLCRLDEIEMIKLCVGLVGEVKR